MPKDVPPVSEVLRFLADEMIAYSDKPVTVRSIAEQIRELAQAIDETMNPHFRRDKASDGS